VPGMWVVMSPLCDLAVLWCKSCCLSWFTDTVPAVGKFPEPVQTFDYGHGAASRRMDIPNTGMTSLLKHRGFFLSPDNSP
jgi:hypothetical protein